MGLVALAIFGFTVVLILLGKAAYELVERIWEALEPMMEHEVLMRRIEVRLMIDDAGYECPKWLNDEEEEENEEGKVVRLVPKEE